MARTLCRLCRGIWAWNASSRCITDSGQGGAWRLHAFRRPGWQGRPALGFPVAKRVKSGASNSVKSGNLLGCGAKRPCRSSGLRRGCRSARPKGPGPCSLLWLTAKTNSKPQAPSNPAPSSNSNLRLAPFRAKTWKARPNCPSGCSSNGVSVPGPDAGFADHDRIRPRMEGAVRVSRVNDNAGIEQSHPRVSALTWSQLWVNQSGLLSMACNASCLVKRRRGGGIRRKVISSASPPRTSGS